MMLAKAPVTTFKAAPARRNALVLPTRGARVVRRFQNDDEPGQALKEGVRGDEAANEKKVKDISDLSLSGAAAYTAAKIDTYQAPGSWFTPAFTRRREVLAGRLAMVGLTAALIWEVTNPNHPGPIAVSSFITTWPNVLIEALALGFTAHGIAGAVWPGSPTYSRENLQDVAQRPAGPPAKPVNLYHHPATFFGISRKWGFTKKNELFNGRMAMLGFLAMVFGEMRSGYGFIGQVATWLGSVPTELTYSTAGRYLVAWSLFNIGLAWLTGNMGEIEGDEEIY